MLCSKSYFAAGFTLRSRGWPISCRIFWGFVALNAGFDLWCDAVQAFSLAPRVEDHDVQIMNLYWKESASLFQSAGMSSLVRWMFKINELFLCCLAVQCLVLIFVSADYGKWLHRKNCWTSTYFQYLSAKSSLVWLWTQPITRHKTTYVKVFWRSTIEAFSFLAELHARDAP